MARTSSIHVYDHSDLYLTPATLTFNLPKKCFKWYFSSSRATTVPNCFEIHALLYKLWSGQIRMEAQMHAHTPNKNCNNYVSLTRKRARQLENCVCKTQIMRPCRACHRTVYIPNTSLNHKFCIKL